MGVPLRASLLAALAEAGLRPAQNPDAADGVLEVKIDPKGATFTPYHTTLDLTSEGRKIESVDLTGGAIGNNMNVSDNNFRRIAEGIAYNLIAKLMSSPKLEEFAREPRKIFAPAGAAGGIGLDAMKRMMMETMREVSETKAAAADVLKPIEPNFKIPETADDFAVIVGIEKYADLPDATYAERDATAARNFIRALGVPDRNIVLLIGNRATKTSMEKTIEGWLPNNVSAKSRVFFYYSGHGAPDTKTGDAYLVPLDGDPQYLAQTGYPLKRLYSKLGQLKAKSVLVALDSCFSGAGGRSVLAKGTRPLVGKVDMAVEAQGKISVISASAGDQISGSNDAAGYGLFTYNLLQGLNGAAKDAQGQVTLNSLYDYLKPRVQDEARRANRDQTPQLQGGGENLILRAQ